MAEAENNDPIGLDAEDVPTLTLQAQDGEQFTVPREVASKITSNIFVSENFNIWPSKKKFSKKKKKKKKIYPSFV